MFANSTQGTLSFPHYGLGNGSYMKHPTSPSVLVADLEREFVSQTFKEMDEGNSLPSLPHTHKWRFAVDLCSFWHCR